MSSKRKPRRKLVAENVHVYHKDCVPESIPMEDEHGFKVLLVGSQGEKEWLWSKRTDVKNVVILDNQPLFNKTYSYDDAVVISDNRQVLRKYGGTF